MNRRPLSPHRPALDLSPATLAREIDHLDQQQLEHHVNVLLGKFESVAEGAGARIVQDTLAHTKPDGSEPRSSPMCACGCPSLKDHWRGRFSDAVRRDYQWAQDNGEDMLFERLRGSILVAALELQDIRIAPKVSTRASEAELPHERDEVICLDYAGLSPIRASMLETNRGYGSCSPAAIRKTRQRNDLHPDTGHPVPPRDQHMAVIRQLRAEGKSQNVIAFELGIAQSTVSRALRDDEGQAAA